MSIKGERQFDRSEQLFNERTTRVLAQALRSALPSFAAERFTSQVLRRFPGLGLKQRIDCLVTTLHEFLPADVRVARRVLLAALPPPLDPTLSDNDFGQFIWGIPGEYVARYGCSRRELAPSLSFLEQSTQRFSAEFALRPFLARFPRETLQRVGRWVAHDHYHVRRLASEGIRPFLPWGQRVVLPGADIVAVLDGLYADPTRFVTRSVANTLNDLSRLDAQLAVTTVSRWQNAGRQAPAEMDWMARHALRTLLKADHGAALACIGYAPTPRFELTDEQVPTTVRVGQDLCWQARLRSGADQRMRIHLRVHFLKANGTHGIKVFAIKDGEVGAAETLTLRKTVTFKPQTTRTLYPGPHHVELVVNGCRQAMHTFTLQV